MAEFIDVLQVTLVIAAVSIPAVLLAKVLRGDETGSIVDIWSAPNPNAWPRGVQEEEPVRYRFGHAAALQRSGAAA